MNDSQGNENMIEVDDLHFSRAGRPIFHGLNLQVPRQKITAIMGPSGVGKTTLLRMITGQLRPESGSVSVAGQRVSDLDRPALYRLRRRMGMLFQNGALLTDLNVFDNVAFPLRENTSLPPQLIRAIVLTKLHAVGLRGAISLMPSELSGGMARRVALARAMVLDPEVLLYDEPFSGLDPISRGVVLRLIRMTNDLLGLTSVIVSHDVEDVSQVADLAYVIAEGRVVEGGPPPRLRDSRSTLVRQFMTGAADGPVPFHYPAPDYREDLLGGA
ncbi:MAG TPA: ATP-binding cassette domain-containing protein [Chromatiales bacterium]|nr:ATP-binding cassette domain-containing protein [Chromatiales bacterium]